MTVGEWKTAPEILLDQIAGVRDEYLKLRRDMLDQLEWHAGQGDSEEAGRFKDRLRLPITLMARN